MPFCETCVAAGRVFRAADLSLLVAFFLTIPVLSGCTDDPPSALPILPPLPVQARTREAELREVNRNELQTLVEASDRPVLVEFSVLSGCYRCDDMRSAIRQKVVDIERHADVVRIDFNLNRSLAHEVGATVCPSYVVYSQGQVFRVRTWPTSADFVADDVATAVARGRGSQAAVP